MKCDKSKLGRNFILVAADTFHLPQSVPYYHEAFAELFLDKQNNLVKMRIYTNNQKAYLKVRQTWNAINET